MVCQCVYREMGANWGGGERSFAVEWHNFRSQTFAQGLIRAWCPGFEQSGKGPAESGQGGVNGGMGRDEP